MIRRVFLLRSTMLATAGLATAVLMARRAAATPDRSSDPQPRDVATNVTVIYVGGHDCPPCEVWKRRDRPSWLDSELRGKVRYVEVDSQHFRQSYQERYWPEDLLPVLASLPRKSGAPRFLVVSGGKVVANDLGYTRWAHTLEVLKTLTAAT